MAKAFKRKLELLDQAQDAYNHTIEARHMFWVSASGYQLGSLFAEFYDAIMIAPVPEYLDDRQRTIYYEELKKQLRPVIDKAVWVFEKNLETARRLGYESDFVDATEEKLGHLQSVLLSDEASPEDIADARRRWGLDQPIYIQYLKFLANLLAGDLGTSFRYSDPVITLIGERLPATIELAIASMLIAIIFGIPLGFLAAKKYGGWLDHTSLVASLIGISIPVFFLAIILKYIFAVKLGWLPSVGRSDVLIAAEHPTNFYILDSIITLNWEAFVDAIKHLILPAIALGTIPLAVITRITRASVLDVQNEDYVRTARAKGVSPAGVDRRHILRNALLPISTIIGLQTGLLLSGAVLTETVFAWPGLGTWLVDAIAARNYPVLQGGILFIAIIFVMVNLVVDVSYAFINPRIRYS